MNRIRPIMGQNNSDSESKSNQKEGYAARLKKVRTILGTVTGGKITQEKLAALLDVNISTIRHIEAGNSDLQPGLARIIEAKTGIAFDWLMTGRGTPQAVGFSFVPKIKPQLSGGDGAFVYEEDYEDLYSFRTDWLSRKGSVRDMRLAEVSGDSMYPTLKDRDFVLFDTSKISPTDGKIMVVSIDSMLFIKRIRLTPDGAFLVSDNKEEYSPWRVDLASARFLGLVLWRCGEV